MSGHSKWHNIQKTKGAQDAKRAAAFTKIAKELIVAVKEGGGITDPANNSRLATVITKAKAANMPNDNIKRCLEKAAGGQGGDNYETITYEGYGPGGVAVIVETMTAGSLFQTTLDVVVGHVGSLSLGDDGGQAGVVGRIGDTAAFLNSHDQFLCDLGKSGSTLSVLCALCFLNIMPFGMSGHRLSSLQ